MVASLLDLAGLDWPVPDFSTLCRRQKTLTVHIPYRPGTGALHLLIDSTGVKAEGDGEWLARKHGPSKPRDWRKVHLGIDAETLEIRAIEVTGSRIGDVEPVNATGSREPARHAARPAGPDRRRSAHRYGHSRRRLRHLRLPCGHRGARSGSVRALSRTSGIRALTPPRKNGKPWKEQTPGAAVRNDALRSCRRLGRAIWKRWTGYHRRSLVEAKMRCFKLLGERIMSRDFDRQVAQLQIRAAILNRFSALGTPLTQRTE